MSLFFKILILNYWKRPNFIGIITKYSTWKVAKDSAQMNDAAAMKKYSKSAEMTMLVCRSAHVSLLCETIRKISAKK